MYNDFFGFKEPPFSIAPDPRYLYMSERHREALAHLVFGFNSDGGFVLLTGEVGTGKTTVCRCLLEQIPDNSSIAFILNPKLTVEELLATICDEFRISYPEGNTSVKVFVDLINGYLLEAHAKGGKAILIIDEAQNLSADVLEQLRLLTNLETSQCKLLQIILLGQPELRDKLSRPELRQLSQRIIARYHLGPLAKKDLGAYIAHRLSVAGLKKQLFPDSLINKLYALTNGIPRLINVVCDRALLGAYTKGKDSVSKSIMSKAANEVFGKIQKQPVNSTAWLVTALIFLIVGAVLASTYYTTKSHQEGPLITEAPDADPHEAAPVSNMLRWPEEMPVEESQELAYQSLLSQWGLSYDPKDGPACDFAAVHNLQCKFNRGNFRSILLMNRPVVLKLFDEEGAYFYAALTELNNDNATLFMGPKQLDVRIADIESVWLGDYTLIWKTPPDYQGDIHPGEHNNAVPWLNKQLAIINGEAELTPDNMIYNSRMVKQVKEFQIASGLIPDGIVGMQTIIGINSAVGNSFPELVKKTGKN